MVSDPEVIAANKAYLADVMPVLQGIQVKAKREVGEFVAAHPEVAKQH